MPSKNETVEKRNGSKTWTSDNNRRAGTPTSQIEATSLPQDNDSSSCLCICVRTNAQPSPLPPPPHTNQTSV